MQTILSSNDVDLQTCQQQSFSINYGALNNNEIMAGQNLDYLPRSEI